MQSRPETADKLPRFNAAPTAARLQALRAETLQIKLHKLTAMPWEVKYYDELCRI